jgi:hypothetical protein
MSKPCRITFMAFIFGDIPKGLEYGYTDWDLEVGADYCQALLEDGYTHEPHDEFDLKGYIAWANNGGGIISK